MDKPSFDADLLFGDDLAATGTLTVKSDPEQEQLLDSQSPPLSQFDDEQEEETGEENTTQEAGLPDGRANVAMESPHRVEKTRADEGEEAKTRGPAPLRGGRITRSSADQKLEFVGMMGGVRPAGTGTDQPPRLASSPLREQSAGGGSTAGVMHHWVQ
jgi:hypothetical protein